MLDLASKPVLHADEKFHSTTKTNINRLSSPTPSTPPPLFVSRWLRRRRRLRRRRLLGLGLAAHLRLGRFGQAVGVAPRPQLHGVRAPQHRRRPARRRHRAAVDHVHHVARPKLLRLGGSSTLLAMKLQSEPAVHGAREARPAVRARREPPGKVPLPFCKKSGEPPGLNPGKVLQF